MSKSRKANYSLPEPDAWMRRVAELMARDSISFKEAVIALNLPLTAGECEAVRRRGEFEEILFEETQKFRTLMADSPSATKSAAIGMLLMAAEKLFHQGDYDKAAVVVEKLAKLQGWIGSESNINIIAGMTAKDIELAKDKIKAQIDGFRTELPPIAEEPQPN